MKKREKKRYNSVDIRGGYRRKRELRKRVRVILQISRLFCNEKW